MTANASRGSVTAVLLFLAATGVAAQQGQRGDPPAPVWDVSVTGGEFLVGAGVGFGRHAVLGYGSVLGIEPLGFNVGAGYQGDTLQAIGLYRHESPGRLPYLEVVRDRQGGLLLLEYTPAAAELRLTVENQLYVGLVSLRHAGEQLALYDLATASLDLHADYRNRVTLVAELSTIQLLRQAAGAYGVGLGVPMQFLDRTIILEPRLLHSGTTGETLFARDLIGYRFGDFSVGRLFGLLEGVRSDVAGTTALVLNVEYRLHFLQDAGVPIADGVFVGAFADGGLFRNEPRGNPAGAVTGGDFVVGGSLGVEWLNISLAVEAGYHHAESRFVWGIDLKSFR